MHLITSFFPFVIAILACLPTQAEGTKVTISSATNDASGILIHSVESPYQSGQTEIRILPPDEFDQTKTHTVVYVLPVEAKNENKYGNGLAEIKKRNLHNQHQIIFVAPTFSQLPWYADHPTDPEIRQEDYLLKAVIPFIDEHYPVAKNANGRLLLGFSKSGWGAWCLLLRHPNLFGKAIAWDAPLMMKKPGLYGNQPIFGTQEQFDKYRITHLLRSNANTLGQKPRLLLTGYGGFRNHHQRMHSLLNQLKIPHVYRDGPKRKHDWHSGWVEEAVELLVAQTPES